MSKTRFLPLLALLLVLALPALAEPAVTYDAVYSSANPIPEIAQNVRPAVVQVINRAITWSRETGELRHDQGSASAVYVDARGYFITNNHVIEDADEVVIVLLSGTELPAQVVGADGGTDLAVLKVESPIDALPVPLGDSDALMIGELAIAIGNPGASGGVLPASVTAGIISALDREHVSAGNFTRAVKVIQTDAAINSGNSGGALLNAKGELIGIPTLKYMSDGVGVYEGLGFAVPVNTVRTIMAQLIDQGKVVRPRLGVTVMAVDGPESPLRSNAPAGVQVMDVEPGSPAAHAGLLLYDVIMEVDGARVKQITDLTSVIDERLGGDKLTLKVCRFYDPLTTVPLGKYEVLDLIVEIAMME